MLSILKLVKRLTFYGFIGTLLLSEWVLADSMNKCLNLFSKEIGVVFETEKKSVFAFLNEHMTLLDGKDGWSIIASIDKSYRPHIRAPGQGINQGVVSIPDFAFPRQNIPTSEFRNHNSPTKPLNSIT